MKKSALLFLLLFLCTSCFFGGSKHKTYTIFRSNAVSGINLQGKETSIQGFTDDILYETIFA
jgi:hypothetical protein